MTPQELDQQIYLIALSNGFSDVSARFVVAQARLESANYSSNVFQKNNNSFGMKFINQPLATKGTIAPFNERSKNCRLNNVCVNSDFYAKFNSPLDSAKDVTGRLYNITMRGITPDQLKNAKTPLEYATLLKKRGYYGSYNWNTTEGKKEIDNYSKGITARLKKINVSKIETLPGVTVTASKKKFNWLLILLATGITTYILYKKK